jgi:universal stress protein E
MVLNKIFVIIDPTVETQPAFARALQSAHMTGTRLHVYACLNEEVAGGDRDAAVAAMEERLETLVGQCQEAGVDAAAELEWAADWSQQAVRAAARCSASMVFKSSYEHSDVQRELRPTSDFTLLRLSPCPVLLVHDKHDWSSRRVLAAVNSQSTDDAHIKLNNLIISFAQNFTDAYGSDAHFINAYQDANHPPDKSDLSAMCGAPEEHIHLVKGATADVISATAEQLDVDLIIIGTVGRSGLKGRVVGNTSEKILDHTGADILVVS